MSLIVWLPLNGDLENQGLSNITITNNGATVDNNGKIGKCYRFGNGSASNNGINLNDNFVSIGSECSISVWVNPSGNHYHYNGTIISSGDWNHICWSFGLSQDNSQVDLLSSGYNSYVNCPVPLNTWTHLVCTRKNGVTTLYKNGIQIAASSSFGDLASDASNTYIGRETYANGYFTFNGKLNDVRIYDHCLSAKEIKELAKGLVLHYRLAGPGGENLGNTSATYENQEHGKTINAEGWGGDTGTVTYYHYGGYRGLPYKVLHKTSTGGGGIYKKTANDISLEANTQYTMSVWVKSSRNFTDYHYSFNINRGSDNFYITSGKNIEFTTEWTQLITTFTTDSTGSGSYGEMSIIYEDSVSDYYIYFSGFKIEKGPIATPWCPPKNSKLYSILGYNNNVEYDCSGYRRNGTKSGTITWDIDSPRYTTSYKFGSNTSKIKLPAFNMSGFANSYTFSWWQYNIGSNNMPWGFSDGNRLNPYHTGNLCWNTGDGGSNPFVPNIISSTLYNTWHHIVITGNGTDTKLYIDGEYKGKATTYKGLTGPQIYRSGWDTGTSYTMTGSREADFRIYATALSAEDIAELYHSAVIVDNTGKNYAYEYFEA